MRNLITKANGIVFYFQMPEDYIPGVTWVVSQTCVCPFAMFSVNQFPVIRVYFKWSDD